MTRQCLIILSLLVSLAAPARAAVTFQYLFNDGFPLDISHDGTVITGNTVNDFVAFRWTQATGLVSLGMGSVPVLGRGGGKPGISWDGTRVSSTIHSTDSTYATAGLWTLGQGWLQLDPPIPPGAGIIDESLASVWNLSGDGKTVVGLLWQDNGRGHAFRWTAATGMVDLGTTIPTSSSRASGVDFQGNVVVGWDTDPVGQRIPAAWIHGQLHLLLAPGLQSNGEANAVSSGGQFVVGHQRDGDTQFSIRQAAMWTITNGVPGPTQYLGAVEGTAPPPGINTGRAVSDDGQTVVGYCSWGGDPFSTTGFIWTPQTGIKDVVEYLGENGVLIDADFIIQDLTCMTPDGTKIVGFGQMLTAPYPRRAFMITRDPGSVGVPDATPVAGLSLRATPNPARGPMTLTFKAPGDVAGTLDLHDTAGRLVRRLVDGTPVAGRHQLTWDGRDSKGTEVAPGAYYSRLVIGKQRETRKIVVIE
jgi:probable HAF family extracellular repeat protein